MEKKKLIALFVALGLSTSPAWAGEKEQLEVLRQTTLNLIKALVQTGALTQAAADGLIRDAEKSATDTVAAQAKSATAGAEPGVVRVPYVPEVVRRAMKEEIKQEVLAQAKGERWGDPGSLPSWISRISWEGDFRLRYQRDIFGSSNIPPAQFNPVGLTLASNTTEDRNRLRLQARLGMKAKVSDNTSANLRITTGNLTDPVSTNQTLGNNFNKYSLVLDRAYLKSDPYYWLTLSGGKMPNPWLGTDLVWDKDLNFEGVAASFKPAFSEEWNGFLTAGAFPVQEIERSDTVMANNKWLYGYQAGVQWTAPNSSTAKFGVGLYDFRNVEGTVNPALGSHVYDKSAAQAMQKGNSLMYVNFPGDANLYGLASKFKELNLTGTMDWATFDPFHVIVTADFVKNLGYDQAEIAQRTGLAALDPKTKGYHAKLMVGVPTIRQAGEWQAYVAYKYLERDAVLDALTDSDFHLGGTNAKGYILGGAYGIDKNTSLGLRWLSANQIDGATLAIDGLQVDLNAKF